MAWTFVNGEYLFHQPCGFWNEPCVHGCGYIHLSTSTPGTRKKCCVNGRLSSASDNFDEELMMGYVLDKLPPFVRKAISSSNQFSQRSSTYNNLVAMAATVVCNYSETAGFSWHGPGPQSVFMNGCVHHYMRLASSTSQNCGMSYFIFDDIASLAGSADAQMLTQRYWKKFAKVSRMKIHIAQISVLLVLRQEHVQKASPLFPGW